MTRWLSSLGPFAPIGVFLLAAGESAAFLGLVIPGETAVILGGVAAGTGVSPLWAMLLAAVGGAIIGDSVGYWLGDKTGPSILKRPRLAGFASRLDAAQESLARHGWWGLVVARFTSFLRAVVPYAAGMARMPYSRFLLGNAIGGVLWGVAYTMLGYVAGNNFGRFEKLLRTGGLIVFGLAIVIGLIIWATRWVARNPDRVLEWFSPLLSTRLGRWFTTRLEGQAPLLRRTAILWPLAITVVAALWGFGSLLQDTLKSEEFFFFDTAALSYVAGHELTWLVSAARWIGTVTPPLLTGIVTAVFGLYWLLRRHRRGPATAAAVAWGGQWAIIEAAERLIARTPPPYAPLAQTTGTGFPSEYVGALTALLVLLAWPWTETSWQRGTLRFGTAAVIVVLVAAARVQILVAYPSNTLAGMFIAGGWALLACAAFDTRIHARLGEFATLMRRRAPAG